MTTAPVFTITLHHLSPEAKAAGLQYPDVELASVTAEKLHVLIDAMAALVGRDNGGATPELRITAPHGRFTVQVAGGQLRFNSWKTRVGGFDLTAGQIFAIVAGIEDDGSGSAAASEGRSRWLKLTLLVILIVVSNAVTVWMLTRPPPNPFLPDYKLLAPEPANRLLSDVAGNYQTGTREGARGLKIMADGRIHWIKFGLKGAIVEESDLTAKAAASAGRPALFTNGDALVEIVDASTLKFYGDTYRRKLP